MEIGNKMFDYYYLHKRYSGQPNCVSAFKYIVEVKKGEAPPFKIGEELLCSHNIPSKNFFNKIDDVIIVPEVPKIKFVRKKNKKNFNIWEIEISRSVLFEKIYTQKYKYCSY